MAKKIGKSDRLGENRIVDPAPMHGIGSRIETVAKMLGGNAAAGRAAFKSDIQIGRYIREQSMPGVDVIVGLARASGVALEWLATGDGPMRPGEAPKSAPGVLDDEFALVTVYDVRASAGYGAAIDQERPLADIAFRRDWLSQEGLSTKGLAAVTADGDSMEPTIKDGSLLLLDTQQRELAGNRIYILRMDGHLYAKRLQRLTDGSIRVISDNPAYAEEVVDKANTEKLDIIGRVVWVGRRV